MGYVSIIGAVASKSYRKMGNSYIRRVVSDRGNFISERWNSFPAQEKRDMGG